MTHWAGSALEISHLYSPVGLRLVDELSGGAPLGSVAALLDLQDANGSWLPTDVPAVRTPSAIVTYPGLGRRFDVTGPVQTYRVRLAPDFYIPYYRATSDGISFIAYPYNDTNPPSVIVKAATDVDLVPAPNYPFPTHMPVLRGIVLDGVSGDPVADVLVTQGNGERTLTDARGVFALPLRWVQPGVDTLIDAHDQRTNRAGSIQIRLPDAANVGQVIKIR